MLLLKPRPKLKSDKVLGLPETLGLMGESGELVAEWYERKPWSLSAQWDVIVSKPWSGGEWKITQIVAFDSNNQIVKEYDCRVTLCGPIKPQLTEKAIQFRQSHGISLEDDPFTGDSLQYVLEV